MFAILDTNHYAALVVEGPMCERLKLRAVEQEADLFTSVITVQEVTQGWLANINSQTAGRDQIYGYRRFRFAVEGMNSITILDFDEEAADEFHRLQSLRLNVGTMDLKIAAISLSHDALLLSRNMRDFQKVPGLRVENWLDS